MGYELNEPATEQHSLSGPFLALSFFQPPIPHTGQCVVSMAYLNNNGLKLDARHWSWTIMI